MGVPAFFRWLSRKYPSVVATCTEQKSTDVNGVEIPIDTSEPNPNGVEFDNLYLDMNGIIHPCTHPEDKPAPRNEDEMMVAIFECIDRLFRIVRPRKLLYMAIDGVAPRAKMNQQRSRRFRASKETSEKLNEMSRIRSDILSKGAHLPKEKDKADHFDSNCITPGTPFMDRLSECLQYYIYLRLNTDPGWKNIKVILSDANVPGEGEHKIMDYIRKQRAQPDHDPNTQHCLCGADADLIMLGLATHEPNFTIIREEFVQNAPPKPCEICGQQGHKMKDCTGLERPDDGSMIQFTSEPEFIFVRINVLREYLKKDLQMPNLPFEYDFERAIDDWVFMCFFVGNDFLPHLPSLEIREGAIDRLVTLYKETVYKTNGWITNAGDVNLERVQMILTNLGMAEDVIFKTRQQKEVAFKERQKRNEYYKRQQNNRPDWSLVKDTQFGPKPVDGPQSLTNVRQEAFQIRKAGMHTDSGSNKTDTQPGSRNNQNANRRGQKRPHEATSQQQEDEEPNDEVRLWEDGFKDRYYESKFDVDAKNFEFRYSVALHYVRGLCWVLRYYYQGCASWKWYFPYHYAPFASDFVNISGLSTEFERGTKPFQPLEQLMGVFPAASSKHVPEPWTELMYSPESSIIDFYPEDFKIDLNGKKFAWQGVALLPFVDEKRLFRALEPYYSKLTPDEIKRNQLGSDRLYVGPHNSGFDKLQSIYVQNLDADTEVHVVIDGMAGLIKKSNNHVEEGSVCYATVQGLDDVSDNAVYCVNFSDPKYSVEFIFPAVRLPGALEPPKVLKPGDLNEEENRNWRPRIGMAPSNQRAYLPDSGHRMVNHYTPRNYNQDNHGSRDNRYNSNDRGGYNSGGRGGGGYNSGGRGGGYNNWGFNNNGGNRDGYNSRGGSRGGYNQGGRGGGAQSSGYQSGGYSSRFNSSTVSGGGTGAGSGPDSGNRYQQQGYRQENKNRGGGQGYSGYQNRNNQSRR
ncbi:PREDICTED: 5'-3' exoribonuclease 2 homolog [Nicrophorus vespilloides]|uniref:5'-3' exoribonuclease n=1 Tax=Nicrophorus vespilloides TaxID=110193 RepID=A0ABM1NB66_NICVS|nr:PREDICTED: 5'-3' exoribonuclease 2 homolog [Nicrophorus vespilloides]